MQQLPSPVASYLLSGGTSSAGSPPPNPTDGATPGALKAAGITTASSVISPSPVVVQLSGAEEFSVRRDSFVPLSANRVHPGPALGEAALSEERPAQRAGLFRRVLNMRSGPMGVRGAGAGRRRRSRAASVAGAAGGPSDSISIFSFGAGRFKDERTESSFKDQWSRKHFERARSAGAVVFLSLAASTAVLAAALARGKVDIAGSAPGAGILEALYPRLPQIAASAGAAFLLTGLLALALYGPERGLLRRHWQGAAAAVLASLYACSFVAAAAVGMPSFHFVAVSGGSLLSSSSRQAAEEVQHFREEYGPLLAEIASFRQLSVEMGLSTPLNSAIVLLGDLFQTLLDSASMAEAHTAASAIRHLISLSKKRPDKPATQLEEMNVEPEDNELLKGFQHWFQNQIGDAETRSGAVSIKNRQRRGNDLDQTEEGGEGGPAHPHPHPLPHPEAPELPDSSSSRVLVSASFKEHFGGGPHPSLGDAPSGALTEAVLAALSTEWDEFDAIQLEHVSGGRPLQILSTEILRRSGVFSALGVDPAVFRAFAAAIEQGYNPVPYHTSTHAADVVQAMHFLVASGGLRPHLRTVDVLAAIPLLPSLSSPATSGCPWTGPPPARPPPPPPPRPPTAAVVHDVSHSGRNNGFEIATQSEVALLYNDQSVLENASLTRTFGLLRGPQTDFLAHFSKEQAPAAPPPAPPPPALAALPLAPTFAPTHSLALRCRSDQRVDFRRTVVAAVLATDMARHFEKLAEFKTRTRVIATTMEAARAAGREDSGRAASTRSNLPAVPLLAAADPQPFSEADRNLYLAMCLKVADISNAARPRYQHVEWTNRVNEEFHQQGDEEKRLGLPVSAYCDRNTAIVSQTTAGFLSFLALPLFNAWASRFPASRFLVEYAEKNLWHWKGGPPKPAPAAAAVSAGGSVHGPSSGPGLVSTIGGSPALRPVSTHSAQRKLPAIYLEHGARRGSAVSALDDSVERYRGGMGSLPGATRRTSQATVSGDGTDGSGSDGTRQNSGAVGSPVGGVQRRSRKGSVLAAASDAIQAFGNRLRRPSRKDSIGLEPGIPDDAAMELLSARTSVVR
eukprot:tig00000248_g21781.t1